MSLFKFLLTLFFSLILPLQSAVVPSPSTQTVSRRSIALSHYTCPPAIGPLLRQIASFPQGIDLLDQVARQGRVRIVYGEGGSWNPEERSLTLQRPNGDQVALLQTLIFELHNALREVEIHPIWKKAERGEVDKELFVRSIEAWEHENLLRAERLVRQGIEAGQLPKELSIDPFEDFETHYMLQQISGHSQRYAEAYDQIVQRPVASYCGTLPTLPHYSPSEEETIHRYLYWRNGLKVGGIKGKHAKQEVSREMALLQQKQGHGSRPARLVWLQRLCGDLLPSPSMSYR